MSKDVQANITERAYLWLTCALAAATVVGLGYSLSLPRHAMALLAALSLACTLRALYLCRQKLSRIKWDWECLRCHARMSTTNPDLAARYGRIHKCGSLEQL